MREHRKGRLQVRLASRTLRRSQSRWNAVPSRGDEEHSGEASQKQLHFLQTLIDTIPNPIFYKDCNNLYLGCNKAFEQRLGLTRKNILGKSAYDLFPEDQAHKYHATDLALLQKPGEQSYEDTLLYADGCHHDVIIKKATFTDIDGSLGGLVGVTVDITGRKRAERELQIAHDELEVRVRERTAQLAQANEELQNEVAERRRAEEASKESSEKLKLFAYTVVHDLKSPAIGINGLTKLLGRQYKDHLDEKGKKYCDLILRASEHLVALVDKINVYIAAKEVPLKVEEVDMKELFDELVAEVSAVLNERSIVLVQPDGLPRIYADRLSMVRVFRNFLDNAVKYGGEELSEIRIAYEETEDFHVFSVSDNGVGLGENAEKIFSAFHRNETAKGTEGAGLGLCIVREIAERHAGNVWVTPGKSKGSTFAISIGKALK